jgi:hypothetical protein
MFLGSQRAGKEPERERKFEKKGAYLLEQSVWKRKGERR